MDSVLKAFKIPLTTASKNKLRTTLMAKIPEKMEFKELTATKKRKTPANLKKKKKDAEEQVEADAEEDVMEHTEEDSEEEEEDEEEEEEDQKGPSKKKQKKVGFVASTKSASSGQDQDDDRLSEAKRQFFGTNPRSIASRTRSSSSTSSSSTGLPFLADYEDLVSGRRTPLDTVVIDEDDDDEDDTTHNKAKAKGQAGEEVDLTELFPSSEEDEEEDVGK